MYVGTQVAPRDVSDLEVWAQLGVNNICADPFMKMKMESMFQLILMIG